MAENEGKNPSLSDFLSHAFGEDDDCVNCAAAVYSGAVCDHISVLGDISGIGVQRMAFHVSASVIAWMVEGGYDADELIEAMRARASDIMSEGGPGGASGHA